MGNAYNPVPTVAPEVGAVPYENLDLPASAFGADVAQGVENLGRTAEHVADEQFRIALDLQHQQNETLVLDASSTASTELGKIEAEYRQLHGNKAVAALPEYQKRVEKIGETVGKTLKSPETQAAFHARFTSYKDSTLHGFGLYAADQSDQAYVNAIEGSIDAAKSRLVRESGLGKAAPNYDELVDNVARLGAKMGWEPEQAHAFLQKQTGDVVGDLVAARIAANQLGQAQKIFQTAVKATVPGTDLPFLNSDSQARISHTLHSEIKAQETLARAEGAEDAHNLAQSDVQSRMLTGQPLPPEYQSRIRAGMTPRQWDAYQADIKRADTVYRATGDINKLPTTELAGVVEKLKPVPGTPDFNDQNAAYAHAVQIAQNTIKLRQTDPGQAVREAFPTKVGAAWQAYEAKPSPESLQNALKASEVAQVALGIPALSNRRDGLMPVTMARNIAGQIASAPPTEAHKQLQSWADQFGPYWNKGFRQMSGLLSPAMKVAAIMPNDTAASLLIETSRQDQAKLSKSLDIPATGSNSLSRIIATDPRMVDLRSSLSQRRGGGGTAQDVSSSVEILAKGYMQTRGMSQGEAVENAFKRVIDDKYSMGYVNDRPFHVQHDRDVKAITAGAEVTMKSVAAGVLDLPPQIPQGMTADDANAQWASSIRNNGYWVTNDDASGLILYSERGVPVTINRKPVTYTWDQLQRAAIEHPQAPGVLETRTPGVN